MESNNQTYFKVGEITVTIETQDGEVVEVTAVDSNGNPYVMGFAMGRAPINGGGCQMCTFINGVKKCWDIDCAAMVAPVSYGEQSS